MAQLLPQVTTALRPIARWILLGALVLPQLGCGGADPESSLAKVNSTNLQRLANLYMTYQSKHNWQGPRNEADFKQFLRDFNPDKLRRIGVEPDQVDAVFVSERDGQPFQVRYGVAGSAMGSSEPVVFEAQGANGQRQVGFLNMTQQLVDEAQYQALWDRGAAASATPAESGEGRR